MSEIVALIGITRLGRQLVLEKDSFEMKAISAKVYCRKISIYWRITETRQQLTG